MSRTLQQLIKEGERDIVIWKEWHTRKPDAIHWIIKGESLDLQFAMDAWGDPVTILRVLRLQEQYGAIVEDMLAESAQEEMRIRLGNLHRQIQSRIHLLTMSMDGWREMDEWLRNRYGLQ
jgi:hypothetical protein